MKNEECAASEDSEARRVRINDEANLLFDRIGSLIQEQLKAGAQQIPVVDVLHKAGLRISEGALCELGIPLMMLPHTFLPWHEWFPWKPLWSYFFSLHYPGSIAARAFIGEGKGFEAGARLRLASVADSFCPPQPLP